MAQTSRSSEKNIPVVVLSGLRWLEHRLCEPGDPPPLRRQKVSLGFFLSGAWVLPLIMGVLSWWAMGFGTAVGPMISLLYSFGCLPTMWILAAVYFHTKALTLPRTLFVALNWLYTPVALISQGGFQYNSFVGVQVVLSIALTLILYESFTAAAVSATLSCVTIVVWAVVEATMGLPVAFEYNRVGSVVWHAAECFVAPPFIMLALWYLVHTMREEIVERTVAEARAVATAEARAAFVARMSHEIRSPLTGIIGLAELLSKTSLSGVQKQYTASIGLCGKALLAVINDVLTF
eukprot:RCo005189